MMSELGNTILATVTVALLLQSVAFATLVVGDSVLKRRVRRLSEEIVSLRSAIRAASGVDEANGVGGGSR